MSGSNSHYHSSRQRNSFPPPEQPETATLGEAATGKALKLSFRNAAQSLAHLYTLSLQQQRKSFESGYGACLADLSTFLSGYLAATNMTLAHPKHLEEALKAFINTKQMLLSESSGSKDQLVTEEMEATNHIDSPLRTVKPEDMDSYIPTTFPSTLSASTEYFGHQAGAPPSATSDPFISEPPSKKSRHQFL